MSHFVTLVDFYMPEVEENLEETAHYKAQIAEAKEALAQSQGGNSFALRLTNILHDSDYGFDLPAVYSP